MSAKDKSEENRISIQPPPQPKKENQSLSSGIGFIGMLVVGAAIGLGKSGLKAGRAVRHVPHGARNLDELAKFRGEPAKGLRGLGGPPEGLGGRVPNEAPLLPPEGGKPHDGFGVKDIDVPGLFKDATQAAAQAREPISDEALQRFYEAEGLTIRIRTSHCREEYRGNSGQPLNMQAIDSESETTAAVGNVVLESYRKKDKLPDRAKGEHARCRVRFGSDGRPFMSMDSRYATDSGNCPIDFQGNYELELLDGTEGDFQNGKPIRLRFSPEGLRRFENDCKQKLEAALAAMLRANWDPEDIDQDLARRARATLTYQRFPNSVIMATPSHVIMEDVGPSSATLRLTFPPK